MTKDDAIRLQLLQIVDNQLQSNNPAHTRFTFDRLVKMGFSEANAKLHLARCVSTELFYVMQRKEPFNEKRFVKNLDLLPGDPTHT
jgi:hypothetical protein